MTDNERKKASEPFHVIISPSLYLAIKYNQSTKRDEKNIPDEEIVEFEKFKALFKQFLDGLNKQDQSSLSLLSSIMSLWGYNRKYCGLCGKPIIGRGESIQNRLTCRSCFDSYKITEELYRREGHEEEKFTRREYRNPQNPPLRKHRPPHNASPVEETPS